MAEYVAMTSALRDVISITELLKELTNRRCNLILTASNVYCKSFEDNSGALKIACLLEMQPHTKAINVIYHHFYEHVCLGKISIYPIATYSQLADVFTKPLQNIWKQFLEKNAFFTQLSALIFFICVSD